MLKIKLRYFVNLEVEFWFLLGFLFQTLALIFLFKLVVQFLSRVCWVLVARYFWILAAKFFFFFQRWIFGVQICYLFFWIFSVTWSTSALSPTQTLPRTTILPWDVGRCKNLQFDLTLTLPLLFFSRLYWQTYSSSIQREHGDCPLHLVRIRWQWSHARLTLRLTGAELLRSSFGVSVVEDSIFMMVVKVNVLTLCS